MDNIALWITGLPGSGKSVVADSFKARHPDFVVLRMDELRKIITPEPTYSDTERDTVYRCLVCLAKNLTDLGHSVIIDATGNLRKWRSLARELIPAYAEVYLKCAVEVCRGREQKRKETRGAPRDIYNKGNKGWPVPGVNAPYEEPDNPEIVIDAAAATVEETVKAIEAYLSATHQK
ncbi:MAG: adenylyl-sulfate kinase [Nitrospiraceae bacterium]|nr:adenylyl-sulfate kinase [Nitrospiraceae bacterium]